MFPFRDWTELEHGYLQSFILANLSHFYKILDLIQAERKVNHKAAVDLSVCGGLQMSLFEYHGLKEDTTEPKPSTKQSE